MRRMRASSPLTPKRMGYSHPPKPIVATEAEAVLSIWLRTPKWVAALRRFHRPRMAVFMKWPRAKYAPSAQAGSGPVFYPRGT
jgi:hypothetical protein